MKLEARIRLLEAELAELKKQHSESNPSVKQNT